MTVPDHEVHPFTLVVTTIAQPTASMVRHSEGSKRSGASIVVAGDEKGPGRFDLDGVTFLSLEKQREFSQLGQLLPTGSYTRKNIAYLFALAEGTQVIVETDDDNSPMPGFYSGRTRNLTGGVVDHPRWFNIYSLFSDTGIWPRGLPLEHVKGSSSSVGFDDLPETQTFAPIQQGLADGDPDVDAVYRMTRGLPVTFASGRTVFLSKGTWCPFNSQNTTWFPEAFPLMYLPSYGSFRMTDIWRSLVAQRIAWANDWLIAFSSPDVLQDRNEHNLLADFRDEMPGYLNNDRIAQSLEDLDLAPGDLGGALLTCYETLISLGVVGVGEMELLRTWLSELKHLPRMQGTS